MRVILVLILTLLFSISHANLEEGLVAYYPFNGNGNDESGNNLHGTLTGADSTEDRFGNYGTAFMFGNNPSLEVPAVDYITIPDTSALRLTDSLSFSFWINPANVNGRHIIAKQLGDGQHNSFVIWFEHGSGLKFSLENIYGSYTQPTASIPALDKWHHIVATWDSLEMKLYVNRSEACSGIFTGPIAYDSNPIIIGADDNDNDDLADEGWVGILDDFRIYSRVLSEGDISQLYFTGNWMNQPENIQIVIDSQVNISWDAVIGATSYKVYSNSDPYEPWENWVLEGEVNITCWSEFTSESKKFYYVKAVN